MARSWCGSRRSGARVPGIRVIVVTGHQTELVDRRSQGLKVRFVKNPDFAGGIATSVKAGIAAVSDDAAGAVVCLGDMPLIDAGLIDRLIDGFAPDRGNLIVVPSARAAAAIPCCGRAASSRS